MNNPYVMERYAQEKHADRVHKSEAFERVAAPQRSSSDCPPTLARRLVVAMLTAPAALARGKR